MARADEGIVEEKERVWEDVRAVIVLVEGFAAVVRWLKSPRRDPSNDAIVKSRCEFYIVA